MCRFPGMMMNLKLETVGISGRSALQQDKMKMIGSIQYFKYKFLKQTQLIG